jgi:hypothetical protein
LAYRTREVIAKRLEVNYLAPRPRRMPWEILDSDSADDRPRDSERPSARTAVTAG